MKTLFLTTAAIALTAGFAVAQDAAPADPLATPEVETEAPEVEAAESSDMNTDGGGGSAMGAFADTAVRDIVGKNVLAEDGNNVGEVEALFIEGDQVQAVVGVGGFLGIGEHDVAVPLADFVVTDQGMMLPELSQEELEAMNAFDGEAESMPLNVTVAGDPVEEEVIPVPDAGGVPTDG